MTAVDPPAQRISLDTDMSPCEERRTYGHRRWTSCARLAEFAQIVRKVWPGKQLRAVAADDTTNRYDNGAQADARKRAEFK
jgi:hypothetical protein